MTESVCGAIIGCARVCSRLLLDWRFFSVPFLVFMFVAHSVDFVMRRYLLVSCLFDLKQLGMFCV